MKRIRRRKRSRKIGTKLVILPRLIIASTFETNLSIIYQDQDFHSGKEWRDEIPTFIRADIQRLVRVASVGMPDLLDSTIYLKGTSIAKNFSPRICLKDLRTYWGCLERWAQRYPWPKISKGERYQRKEQAEREIERALSYRGTKLHIFPNTALPPKNLRTKGLTR